MSRFFKASFLTIPSVVLCIVLTPSKAIADGIKYKDVTDLLFMVLESDRKAYAQMIIDRLVNEYEHIEATESYEDDESAPLPAQMFRFGAELTSEKTDRLSYSLISQWPINKQNAPRTESEEQGLSELQSGKAESYYTEETLGGNRYFTAIYPDIAVAESCIGCHNDHKDSPRSDFQLGEMMGGVAIRILLQ